jgi:hypothetical protein
MDPHILRASHHLSYDWLILNESRMEIAVPIKAGIVNGISGSNDWYRSVRKSTVKETMLTYTISYFILLSIYDAGIPLLSSMAEILYFPQRKE